MGTLHLKEAEIKTVGGKRYVWRFWGDPLTSEDLHGSLMFIWLTLHKNKFLPLSLFCAKELDRPWAKQPQPQPDLFSAHQWHSPNGSWSSGREADIYSGNISNHLLSKNNQANRGDWIASGLETCYQPSAIQSPSERQGAHSPPQAAC